jgi:hypothetical protein
MQVFDFTKKVINSLNYDCSKQQKAKYGISDTKDKELLSRRQTTVLRGMAILFVMFHNFFCHVFDIPTSGEFYFDAGDVLKLQHLFETTVFRAGIGTITFYASLICIQIFTFLSGYGLVMRYEKSGKSIPDMLPFIRSNYFKLLSLLLICYAMFTVYLLLGSREFWPWLIQAITGITLLGNLSPYPESAIHPFPMWFLGMLLQLYIIYHVFFCRRSSWVVVVFIAVALAIKAMHLGEDNWMTMYHIRVNGLGWMLPFGLGILYARHGKATATGTNIAVFAISSTLLAITPWSETLWVLSPAFACTFAISLIKLTPTSLQRIVYPIGILSPWLYAIHPTVRDVFLNYSGETPYLVGQFLIYISIVFLLTIVFYFALQYIKLLKK